MDSGDATGMPLNCFRTARIKGPASWSAGHDSVGNSHNVSFIVNLTATRLEVGQGNQVVALFSL